jgi:hypothetical protein
MLPPGTRTVSEREKSLHAAHLMGRLALKLSSSSLAPCKFLISIFGVCVEPHKGAPRQTAGLLAVKRVGASRR